MTAIQCNVAGNPAPRLYYERLKCDLRNEVNICIFATIVGQPTIKMKCIYTRLFLEIYKPLPITGTKVNITTVTLTSEALRVLINRAFHGAPPFHLVSISHRPIKTTRTLATLAWAKIKNFWSCPKYFNENQIFAQSFKRL
jgi:hypothetical protein